MNFTIKVSVSPVATNHAAPKAPFSIPTQLLAIATKVSLHLTQAVTAKLLAHCLRQGQRHHSLADHSGRRYDGNVGAFEGRFLFLLGINVNRAQRAPQS